MERERTRVEPHLCNTRALLSRTQYVHLDWDLALLLDSQGLVEKNCRRVVSFLIQEQEEARSDGVGQGPGSKAARKSPK
jgi:hypothetical protein